MKLRLQLSDFQLAVIERLQPSSDPARSASALLAEAIEFDAAGTPQPRRNERRPAARRASPRRRDGLLDTVLPAATARGITLAQGHTLRIEQLADGQCVDLDAFELELPYRRFSAARTRMEHGIHPSTGATLYSTPPEVPLLSILADSAPGHDLCFPACTAFEYEQLTGVTGHRSCHQLHRAAHRQLGLDAPVADPLNLWLPSELTADGKLRSWPAACRRGDYVEMLAHADLVVVLSACPDDVFGSSQYEPHPVRVIVRGSPPPRPRATRALKTPAASRARNTLTVELPAALRPALEQVRAGGWLGFTPAEVARALLFRRYEAARSSLSARSHQRAS